MKKKISDKLENASEWMPLKNKWQKPPLSLAPREKVQRTLLTVATSVSSPKRQPLPLSWNILCSRGPEQATPFIGTAAANPLPCRRCTGANFCPMNGPNKRNLFFFFQNNSSLKKKKLLKILKNMEQLKNIVGINVIIFLKFYNIISYLFTII